MDKALKALVSRESLDFSYPQTESSKGSGNLKSAYSSNFCSECLILGQKSPLDLTLKTYMRVVSSSSVNWFHRSTTSGNYNGVVQFSSQNFCYEDQCSSPSSGSTLASQAFSSKALHSWVYPQSSLSNDLILAFSVAAGGVDS